MTPEQIIILLLFLILLALLLIWWYCFRRAPFRSTDSVVLYNAKSIIDNCGVEGVVLYGPNLVAPIAVNVEVERERNSCNVILSTKQNPKFLQVGPQPLDRAAPIILGVGDSISYSCQKDVGAENCVFDVKITRI